MKLHHVAKFRKKIGSKTSEKESWLGKTKRVYYNGHFSVYREGNYNKSKALRRYKLALLRNPFRTLPALTDSDRGMRIGLSNITTPQQIIHFIESAAS